MSLMLFKAYLADCVMHSVPDAYLFEGCVMELEDFLNEMVFEFIRDLYDRTAPKKSIRAHLIERDGEVTDDARQKYARLMAYVQKARKRQYDEMKDRPKELDFGSTEKLRPPEMEDIRDRTLGYQLNAMQFFEMDNISELSLVKAVTYHRLEDVKKISNTRFIEIQEEYDAFVSRLNNKQVPDAEIIFNAQAYYVLEWKYIQDYAYVVATALLEQKATEIPFPIIGALCADTTVVREASLPNDIMPFEALSTESRFVQSRLRYIPEILSIPEDQVFYDLSCIAQYLRLKTYLMKFVTGPNGEDMVDWFASQTTEKERADFIRNDYWLFDCQPKKEWTPAKIRMVREICAYFLTAR